MRIPAELRCFEHGSKFESDSPAGAITLETSTLTCPRGCRVPVVRGIPRFVDSEHYASSFGLQWRTFRKTQHDSANGTTLSRTRLERCLGDSLESLSGKSVLEAGCGSGRFTELLLEGGAFVFAVDLSSAVESNYQNCLHPTNYFVCQADIRRIPVAAHQFDVVVCLGVIQHTPDSEQTMSALCSHLKPGGLLVIDHYQRQAPGPPQKRPLRFIPGRVYPSGWLRSYLLGKPASFSLRFTKTLVALLWPAHRILWRMRHLPGGAWARRAFTYYSPVADGHEVYPGLSPRQIYEWSVLDTHDRHTDYYKHLRTAEEIEQHLRSCGMTNIHTAYGGNGVEARATAPEQTSLERIATT